MQRRKQNMEDQSLIARDKWTEKEVPSKSLQEKMGLAIRFGMETKKGRDPEAARERQKVLKP